MFSGAVLILILAWPVLGLTAGTELSRTETAGLPNGLLTQLTLGLALVLAVAVGLSWLLRRHVLPRGGAIRVIGGLPLGQRERLLLIEVEETRLLIGITAQQIQTLHIFPATPPFMVAPPDVPPDLSDDRPPS